jgi:trimeric autotransporter adhesin
VPGATVTLTQGAKQFLTVTDQQGFYQFADLADGQYVLRIEMRGFSTFVGEVKIAPDAPQSIWQLKLLGLEQMLAQATPVDTADSSAEAVNKPPPEAVRPAEVPKAPEAPPQEMPHPTDENADRSSDGLLINGSENNAATSQFTISPAFGNRRPGAKGLYNGSFGVIADQSTLDAKPYSLTGLEEPKAQYSRVTTAVTLGGPIRIPHLLYHGPNFFLAYQWTRNRDAATQSGLVPDVQERSGDLSGLLNAFGQPISIFDPTTGLPFTGLIPVSSQAQFLLQLYPLPNLAGNSSYNYQTQVLNNTHMDALQSRLDKTIGRRDQLYGGFGFRSTRADNTSIFEFRDVTNTLGIDSNANWVHHLHHQILLTTTYHFTRLRTEVRPNFDGRENISAAAGITGNDQDTREWGPPKLVFSSGIASLDDAQSSFDRNRTDTLSISASSTRGHHTVTVGGDFRRQEINQLSQQNPRGDFTFTGAATQSATSASGASGSDLADFLFGVPDTSAIAYGNADKYFRQSVYDVYFMDDWRVLPELTVNAGMRWDYGAPLTELFGRLVNLDVAPGFAAVAPVLGNSPKGSLTGMNYPTSLVRPDKLGFQPRIGVSWRPIPASTLVVRAGYGIYEDTSVYLTGAELMSQQAPLSKSVSVARSSECPLTLANGFQNCVGTTADVFAVNPNLRAGYAQTWQLSAQRDLPRAMVMTVSYLGTKGTRGMQEFLPNTYPIGAANPCPACPAGFVFRTSNGNSTREAGTVQLRRRLRSGFTASLQYTYAKAIDDDSQVGAQGHTAATSATSESQSTVAPSIAQNWLNLRGERGLSTFDQRHLFKAQIQYTTGMGLHGGTLFDGWRGTVFKQWTVLSQISVGSGLPETPVYLAAVTGTGVTGTIRPNLTGAPVYQATTGHFLNVAAYSAPTSGQWGNARRNSITGPDQFSLDSSLARTFRLREPMNLDVRVDATNVLNHAVFTTWNSTINSTTFGLPVVTNPMRSLQVTGRLRF